jgi:S-adenosylmethionine/arginine decarboxylase-like enzyme
MIHILFTLTGCDAALIDSEEHVRQVLFDACQTAKTTWLQTASHKFEPQVTMSALRLHKLPSENKVTTHK